MTEPVEGTFSGNLFCHTTGVTVRHEKGVWAAIKNFFKSDTVGVCVQVDGKKHTIYVSLLDYDNLQKQVFFSTKGSTSLKTIKNIRKIFSSFFGDQETTPWPRVIFDPDLHIQGENQPRYKIPPITEIQHWSPKDLEVKYKSVPMEEQVNFLATVAAAVVLDAVKNGAILGNPNVDDPLQFKDSDARRLGQKAVQLLIPHMKDDKLPPGFQEAVNSHLDIQTELGNQSSTLFLKAMDALFYSVQIGQTAASETKPYVIPPIKEMRSWSKKDLQKEYKKVPKDQQLEFLARFEAAVILSAIERAVEATARSSKLGKTERNRGENFNKQLEVMVAMAPGQEAKPILFMDPHFQELGNAAAVLLVEHGGVVPNPLNPNDAFVKAAAPCFTGTSHQQEALALFPHAMKKFLSFAEIFSSLDKAAKKRSPN